MPPSLRKSESVGRSPAPVQEDRKPSDAPAPENLSLGYRRTSSANLQSKINSYVTAVEKKEEPKPQVKPPVKLEEAASNGGGSKSMTALPASLDNSRSPPEQIRKAVSAPRKTAIVNEPEQQQPTSAQESESPKKGLRVSRAPSGMLAPSKISSDVVMASLVFDPATKEDFRSTLANLLAPNTTRGWMMLGYSNNKTITLQVSPVCFHLDSMSCVIFSIRRRRVQEASPRWCPSSTRSKCNTPCCGFLCPGKAPRPSSLEMCFSFGSAQR